MGPAGAARAGGVKGGLRAPAHHPNTVDVNAAFRLLVAALPYCLEDATRPVSELMQLRHYNTGLERLPKKGKGE